MQPDWVLNLGPLALESDMLPTGLCSPATLIQTGQIKCNTCLVKTSECTQLRMAVCTEEQLRHPVSISHLFYAPEGTSGGILKSHRPSVTNRVSAKSHKLLKQI